ncbi:MAG: hypothetical protein ACJ760_16075 [Thermoleophilaceae bacterium]
MRGRWTPHRSLWSKVLLPVMVIVFVLIATLVALSVDEMVAGNRVLAGINDRCENNHLACDVVSGMALSLFPIAIAVLSLFLFRLHRVRSGYRRYAWKHPEDLLEAEIPSSEIVGRDDLCKVLQHDLESRWENEEGIPQRRPVILVGSVGAGKTAVLARLTKWLAERGAVPVPVRLRAVQDGKLDLLELARRRFLQAAPVISEAEADKIWRRMRESDQIVIVADGLEEALMTVEDTRETSLRVALADVRRHGVALIVGSRPHGALPHLDAAMVPLEPLEPRAALAYITAGGATPEEEERARQIVEAAEVAEMPLFMHYARELRDAGALDRKLDVREVGRLGLRVRLLKRWTAELVAGSIQPDVPVKPARREQVINQLQRYAALGLLRDSLEVTFEDIKASAAEATDEGSDDGADPPRDALATTTEGLREVAADADRLELVTAQRDGIRFRHSVLQAYLGSCVISAELDAEARHGAEAGDLTRELDRGLESPGRELLMALSMACATCQTGARRRAIRLLLRNVDLGGSKAVGTAAAVVAAASAAAIEDPRPVAVGATEEEQPPSLADFRQQVMLWLKRAETEDAERAAVSAEDRATDADFRAARQLEEVAGAVVRASAVRSKLHDLSAEAGDESARTASEPPRDPTRIGLLSARRAQLQRELEQAESAVVSARAQLERYESEAARAWGAVCVTNAVLAEKQLAEAEAGPEVGSNVDLQKPARTLDNALEAADRARQIRSEAAAGRGNFAGRNLEVGALAELLVAQAAAAHALLTEKLGADDVIEQMHKAAAGSELLRQAAGADDLGPEDLGRRAHQAANDADKAILGVTASGPERTRLERAERALGSEPDPNATRPRLRDLDTAQNAVESFKLAAVAAENAAAKLEDLEKVRDAAEAVAEPEGPLGWRGGVLSALSLEALALAKARKARKSLAALEEAPKSPGNEQIGDVGAGLAEVSQRIEEEVRDEQSNGVRNGRTRWPTSRWRVLVPIEETTASAETGGDEDVHVAKLDAIARLSEGAQYLWLWHVCMTERDYPVRLEAARRLGDGGSAAFGVVHEQLLNIKSAAGNDRRTAPKRGTAEDVLAEAGLQLAPEQAFELLGILAPLLYASVERERGQAKAGEPSGDRGARSAATSGDAHRKLLEDWVRRVRYGVYVTSDMALAQGFRFAANDRTLAPGTRGFLAARARDQLRDTDFWFTRIALLQALTLWLLTETEPGADGKRDRAGIRDAEQKIYTCCDPSGHPMVLQTVELCATAFRRRQPANYLWLDEGLAISKLGAGSVAVRQGGTARQWIPPSAGWLSLARPAQRLLGDLAVFLNLADRGDDHATRNDRLARTKPAHDGAAALPPCMRSSAGRRRLDVGRRLDERVEPGARCAPDCEVQLCPYPGLGEEMARGDLSEAFCRRQHAIAHGRELKEFWRGMELRPRA